MKKLQPINFLIYLYGLIIIECLIFYPNKIFAKDINKNKRIEVNKKSNQLQSKNIDYASHIFNEIYLSKNEVIKDLKAEGKKMFDLLAFEQKDLENKYFVEIDSDIQYKEGEVFFAKGNAIIYLSDATLRGELIKYDLKNKLLTVVGNVIFKKGEQYFEASKLSYDLRNDTGYIDNVYGLLDSESFAEDFKLDLNNKDRELIEQEKINGEAQPKYIDSATIGLVNEFEDDKTFNITNTDFNIPSIIRWRYKTEKLLYNSKTLESKKIFFTNDLYNKPQLVFLSKNFSSEIIDNKLRLISKSSWLVLDDKLSIPIGRREFFDKDPSTRWGFGADFQDKDGYYLFRSSNPRKIFKDYDIQLQPYFLIQRALKGQTNAFTKKDSSILSEKVKSDVNFSDYFGIDININGNEKNWDIESKSQLSSLNTERLNEAIRSKLTLTKRINLNKKDTDFNSPKNPDSKISIRIEEKDYTSSTSSLKLGLDSTDLYSEKNKSLFKNFLDLQFYNVYREKVKKDFATEEIYFASGLNVSNKKTWSKNDKDSSLALIYDVGHFKSESNVAEQFTDAFRNTLVAQYNYEFPLWTKSSLDKKIDESFKFTPKVINQSLKWTTGFQSGLFLYSEGSSQSALKFKTGPVLTLGSYKKKFLDYTQISTKYSYVLKGGESPFKFDQINKDPRINVNFRQQVYGPLVFSYENVFNLNDGTHYNETYALDFNRRAYSLGAFYNSTDESVGIRFNIYNFDYSGLSPEF